jgi:hypothetical protein
MRSEGFRGADHASQLCQILKIYPNGTTELFEEMTFHECEELGKKEPAHWNGF